MLTINERNLSYYFASACSEAELLTGVNHRFQQWQQLGSRVGSLSDEQFQTLVRTVRGMITDVLEKNAKAEQSPGKGPTSAEQKKLLRPASANAPQKAAS